MFYSLGTLVSLRRRLRLVALAKAFHRLHRWTKLKGAFLEEAEFIARTAQVPADAGVDLLRRRLDIARSTALQLADTMRVGTKTKYETPDRRHRVDINTMFSGPSTPGVLCPEARSSDDEETLVCDEEEEDDDEEAVGPSSPGNGMMPQPQKSLYVEDVERTAKLLGRAVYSLGERLYGIVEADYREVPMLDRPPVHVTAKHLEVFRKKLRQATTGKVAARLTECVEAVHAKNRSEDLDLDDAFRDLLDAALGATRAQWLLRRRDRREPPDSKGKRRWRTEILHQHRPCRRLGCELCSERARKDGEAQLALGLLKDAGPREYWDLLARTSTSVAELLTAAQVKDVAVLELHLWHIVLFVRGHDRSKGLRLRRNESQRKMIDLRFYELLLLYLCCTVTSDED